ncbi:ABC transporter ATPase [Salmonella enterica subsp. arizonae]|uniref:ABC transporter ATPase n=1 Tax=Salmonella enterica subsp. arizonae TaxID=59203 RepID=A0A379SNH3_SALER|nr:ABC transporter ATPase [Salmonella enterica subsp. arizonae]
MSVSVTDDITFRKLTIFMTFMEKGNIARTAEVLDISGVSVHRRCTRWKRTFAVRSLSIKGVI